MNTTELIAAVARKASLSAKDAASAVGAFKDIIIDTLKNGDGINLTGFGAFSITERTQRVGRNPRTGEEITIPARKVVRFSPGKILKDSVKEKEDVRG